MVSLLKLAERDARKIGLRQSVVGSTTDPHDLDTSVLLQAEANAAFRDLGSSLRMMSDHVATLRSMISEWDEVITTMQRAFDSVQEACA